MIRIAGVFVAAFVALSVVGCSADTAPIPEEPQADMEAAMASQAEAQLAAGREVYDAVCSECHSLQPPPNLAPPITHIARRLRGELTEESAFIAHVAGHISAPTEEGSLLPAHAVERFGLMPAQNLTEDQLSNVAAWLWVMADSAQMGMDGEDHEMGEGGMGEGMHGGMGEGGMGGGGMGQGRMGGGGMSPPVPDTAR